MHTSPVQLADVASTDHAVRAWTVLQAIKTTVLANDDSYMIFSAATLRRVARLHGVDVR